MDSEEEPNHSGSLHRHRLRRSVEEHVPHFKKGEFCSFSPLARVAGQINCGFWSSEVYSLHLKNMVVIVGPCDLYGKAVGGSPPVPSGSRTRLHDSVVGYKRVPLGVS